jgi:type IV pilus assembly protein PilB
MLAGPPPMSAPTNTPGEGNKRIRLGELLVQAGVLSAERLQEALDLQKSEGSKRRLGRLLVDSGFVDETQLTQVLGRQLSVPWVSLYHVDFSRQLLNLVPREVAEGYGVIPVYVRNVRGQGETLYVATDDPTNDEGLRKAAAYAGLPVRPMIASASDIRSAIRAYYGGGTGPIPKVKVEHVEVTAPPTTKNEKPEKQPETVAAKPPEPEPAPVVLTPPEKAPYDDTPEIEAKSIPPPARKKGRSIALTFLDGTTINLPAPRANKLRAMGKERAQGEDELTARDLIAALRAVSHGAEAQEILGENPRWEAMFAALLSLLLRKHLIADWEFVEEFRKI